MPSFMLLALNAQLFHHTGPLIQTYRHALTYEKSNPHFVRNNIANLYDRKIFYFFR